MGLKGFKQRTARRAVALITAMVACLFLLLLTGALIQTQSSAFAISQSSDARVRARAACQTLYDYCLYQLEHNREWGRDGFKDKSEVDPVQTPGANENTLASLENRVVIEEIEGRIFRGYLSEHGTSFEVEVSNALTNSSGLVSRAGLATSHEHVRLAISTWDGRASSDTGRSRQHVDCLLRLAPLYDASILSRGNIEISSQQALFSSQDPFRNEIRGEGDVYLPGLTQGRTRFVIHNEDVIRKDSNLDDMTYDRTGLLWAGDNIGQNMTPNGGEVLSSTSSLSQAAQRSGGRMVNNASNRADIYDLKPENIPQPTFPAERDITVPPGEYRFTKAVATISYEVEVTDPEGGKRMETRTKSEVLDVLQYHDPPHSAQPSRVMRTPTTLLGEGQSLKSVSIDYGDSDFSNTPVVIGEKFAVNSSFKGTTPVKDADGNIINVPENGFSKQDSHSPPTPVTIDLTTQTVTVAPQTRVRPLSRPENSPLPPSAFELTVKRGPSGEQPQRPTFVLGSGSNDVVFEADGNISIGAGYTKGLGTIISKTGSVTLNPIAQELKWVQKYLPGSSVPIWVLEKEMEVTTNAQYAGLVIYADKDVNITNSTNADWSFRGFVYARGDFHFDVGDQNATFYGSVVAGNNHKDPGAFKILNGKRTTFIYDPNYLKLLTKQLPRNWTRVEPLFWSEANG